MPPIRLLIHAARLSRPVCKENVFAKSNACPRGQDISWKLVNSLAPVQKSTYLKRKHRISPGVVERTFEAHHATFKPTNLTYVHAVPRIRHTPKSKAHRSTHGASGSDQCTRCGSPRALPDRPSSLSEHRWCPARYPRCYPRWRSRGLLVSVSIR